MHPLRQRSTFTRLDAERLDMWGEEAGAGFFVQQGEIGKKVVASARVELSEKVWGEELGLRELEGICGASIIRLLAYDATGGVYYLRTGSIGLS